MRQVVTGLIITVAIVGVRFSSASKGRPTEQTITVQIHDYSRVPAVVDYPAVTIEIGSGLLASAIPR